MHQSVQTRLCHNNKQSSNFGWLKITKKIFLTYAVSLPKVSVRFACCNYLGTQVGVVKFSKVVSLYAIGQESAKGSCIAHQVLPAKFRVHHSHIGSLGISIF